MKGITLKKGWSSFPALKSDNLLSVVGLVFCVLLFLAAFLRQPLLSRVVAQESDGDGVTESDLAGLSPVPDDLTPDAPEKSDSIVFETAPNRSGPKPVPGLQLAAKDVEGDEDAEGADADKTGDPLVDLLKDWQDPKFVFFVTGRQHGYIEPCGCTGLENAKGGLMRRHSMWELIRKRGWNVIPLDVGNQVRRLGHQAEIKFQRVAGLLKEMNYAAVGLGPDDLRLSLNGILFPINDAENFVMSNVSVAGLNRSERVIESSGVRIGITGVLGTAQQKLINRAGGNIQLIPPQAGINKSRAKFQAVKTKFNILLAHASVDETEELVKRNADLFDLVVTAGGAGEPPLLPSKVKGAKAQIVQVGTKGMYVGLVGVFDDPKKPFRYVRVPLDAKLVDSKKVMDIFEDYQTDLQVMGLEGLGVKSIKHPTGLRFVGSETCGDCHTDAMAVFKKTPHHHATESLIQPPNSRSQVARHFDPECLSCHVTGWEPQKYLPFESGYTDVSMKLLHGNGCENCHGPGSAHVAAENGDVDLSEAEIEKLRAQMRLTLEEAKKTKCYECHDIDNSPDFKFDEYWEKVKHYGKD